MSPPRVLIIGCGIAGPVLALLLRKKGYEPIILEKVRELGDAGASLMMMPNGLKVLSLVGLSDFVTRSCPHLKELRDQSSSGEPIGFSILPQTFVRKYGQPACGIQRTALNLALKNAVIGAGIEIREGWSLVVIEESNRSVVAISEKGDRVEGSFLVGADGIKSNSRAALLKAHGVENEKAFYTYLTQTAGMSPTPKSLKDQPGMLNIYGPSAHFICYPVSEDTTSWAITLRDPTEAKETWRIYSPDEMSLHRDKLLTHFEDWSNPVPELIQGVERMIKYGLYDRPHLDPHLWYSPAGRSILIGDAAHPTSPHLGQGANQALEDCYHLSRLLPDFNGHASSLTTEELTHIFTNFATLRQPKTAVLVRDARLQGEQRVIDGGAVPCKARDDLLRKVWSDGVQIERKYDALLREPFQILL